MHRQDVRDILERVENEIRSRFADVGIEFATQTFTNHVELWVYVLDLQRYEEVKAACDAITRRDSLDEMDPEIWMLVKTWTGHWPGGEAEYELRRQRREEFRRQHGLPPRG